MGSSKRITLWVVEDSGLFGLVIAKGFPRGFKKINYWSFVDDGGATRTAQQVHGLFMGVL